jgi:hypothetical protein
MYNLKLSLQLNSMKSPRAISHVRCLYETDVSRAIPDDETRDGPWNIGFIQIPDAADSPRNLYGRF